MQETSHHTEIPDAQTWQKVVHLDSQYQSLDGRVSNLAKSVETIGAKLDTIATSLAGINAGSGRVSAQMLLTTIGVITPIVVAAAALGHIFVNQSDSALRSQITSNRDASQTIHLQLAEMVSNNTDEVMDMRRSIWTSHQHDTFRKEEFQPLVDDVVENRIAQAEWEQRITNLEKLLNSPENTD